MADPIADLTPERIEADVKRLERLINVLDDQEYDEAQVKIARLAAAARRGVEAPSKEAASWLSTLSDLVSAYGNAADAEALAWLAGSSRAIEAAERRAAEMEAALLMVRRLIGSGPVSAENSERAQAAIDRALSREAGGR